MTSDDPSQERCFAALVQLLHGRNSGWLTLSEPHRPATPPCPGCRRIRVKPHRGARYPVMDYRCRTCGKVFNAWTGTAFQGTRRTPADLLRLTVLVAEGATTAALVRDLGWHRPWLIAMRKRLAAEDFVRRLAIKVAQPEANVNGLWLSDLRKLTREARRDHLADKVTIPPCAARPDVP